MKIRLLTLILSMFLSLDSQAQDCQNPCPYYNDFVSMAQAKTVKNTQTKLNYYRAAIVAAKDCNCPQLEQDANKQIDTLFVLIEQEKRKAEAQSRTILEQQKEVREALKVAKKANSKNEKIISAMDFYEGELALASKNDKYGFINTTGETEIEFKYDKGEPFDKGFAEMEREDTKYLIDVEGNEYKLIYISEILQGVDNTNLLIYQDNIKWLEGTLNNKTDVEKVFDEKIMTLQNDIKKYKATLEQENNAKIKAYLKDKVKKEQETLKLTQGKLKKYKESRQAEIGNRLSELRVKLDTIEENLKTANHLFINELKGGNEKLALDFSEQNNLDIIGILKNIVDDKFINDKVELLYLNKTDLDTFPDFITGLKSLKYIYLSGTKIKFIPETIDQLKNLKILICPSLVKEVPSSIYNLENLERLGLSDTEYRMLPEEIGKLKKLKRIRFPRTLKEIPASVYELENLETLYLSYTWIRELSEEIGKLKKLKTLSLPHGLKKIPVSLYDMESLETLFLCAKNEKEVPSAIEKLKSLRYLNIQIPVKELPASISNLENLRNLRLYDTELIRLPETIGDLTKLEQLYLPSTIEEISTNIYKLENLKALSISGWAIEELPEGIDNLINLEQLYLTGTSLKAISGDIEQLAKLERLEFPSSLEILPKGFEKLTNLISLDIEENPNLKQVPDISNFKKLKYFSYTLYQDEYYDANLEMLRELKTKLPNCAFLVKDEKDDYVDLRTEEEIYDDLDLDLDFHLPSMQEIDREIRQERREEKRKERKYKREIKREAKMNKKK